MSDIVGHPGRGNDVVQLHGRVLPHIRVVPGGAGEPPARGLPLPPGIDLLDLLHHLKEPGPAGNAVGFQGGGHGQADGLVRAALVRHHQVGGHGVQPPLHTLHRGVKALEVTAHIGSLFHAPVTPFRLSISQSLSNYRVQHSMIYTPASNSVVSSLQGPPC